MGAGEGMGIGLAVGVGVCMGVSVGVAVAVAVGTGVGVGVGVGSLVGVGVGGLAIDTSMMPVALNPAGSVAVTGNDAVLSSNGVIKRMLPSTTAVATSGLSLASMARVSESPSGSVKNSLRSKVGEGLSAVNSTRGTGMATGPSFTSATVTADLNLLGHWRLPVIGSDDGKVVVVGFGSAGWSFVVKSANEG